MWAYDCAQTAARYTMINPVVTVQARGHALTYKYVIPDISWEVAAAPYKICHVTFVSQT